MTTNTAPRLTVRNLSTCFPTEDGPVRSVAEVSFSIQPGKTTALVGESGSGKSVTSLTLMRLLPKTANAQVSGQTAFVTRDGRTVDLLGLPDREMRRLRGNELSMIFQEPMTSLNPVFTVGEQIADEPTTALDVTIQAQILELMRKLQAETGMSILFITHNLGVVAHHADDVVVMYAGRVVERAPVRPLFTSPEHPYTQGLLACLPGKAQARGEGRPRRLFAIRGQVSSPLAPPPGCAFEPRCDQAIEACRQTMPPLVDTQEGRQARCIRVPAAQPLARAA